MTNDNDLDEIDLAALRACMEAAKLEPGRHEQLESMLKGRGRNDPPQPWLEVARFAAHCVACTASQAVGIAAMFAVWRRGCGEVVRQDA